MQNSKGKIWAARIFSVVLLLGWMNVISGFSSQDGQESSGLSTKVSCTVVRFYDNINGKHLTEEQILEQAGRIENLIRKMAHMTEFGILAVLFLLVFTSFGMKRLRFLASPAAALLYAALDELHQLFVEGRSSKVTDVLIDFAGAVLAVAVVRLLMGIGRIMRKRER